MEFRIGVEVIRVNMPDAAALIAAARGRLRAREGFALATINLDHLVKLRTNDAFRAAYVAQDFIVADGNPIVWLSKLAGRGVSLVPGSDMVVPLAELAAQEGVPVALVGSTPESLRAAALALGRRASGLEIVAEIAPPMGFDPSGPGAEKVFGRIEASGARLVFLALGAPKQEMLAARGRERLPDVGFASIGAGLDFLAGSQMRAPRLVRAFAMEWAWRLAAAPGRFAGRYARCAAILPGQAVAAWRLRGC
ncbi:WecB/TagA/CpsF family glycosyltransferase [Aquicoccus sp. G2-2]|uniref:WecB/TagA/CpsF family glycosyltransferase n=1 Tax=Aquicoccus sp. G2-2 TaxID=3092120 RepID=UPI002AE060F1|nr:WecB/TagA/CpsF family glycosyltransferase [Aquicoccus sp. G2-2]MEA1112597.1 WecB/TagA/CpsF family glycosyltransferase [Aquicoccus sp. G2-2]